MLLLNLSTYQHYCHNTENHTVHQSSTCNHHLLLLHLQVYNFLFRTTAHWLVACSSYHCAVFYFMCVCNDSMQSCDLSRPRSRVFSI